MDVYLYIFSFKLCVHVPKYIHDAALLIFKCCSWKIVLLLNNWQINLKLDLALMIFVNGLGSFVNKNTLDVLGIIFFY